MNNDLKAGQLCRMVGSVGPNFAYASIWKSKMYASRGPAYPERIAEGTIVLFIEYILHSNNTMCKILVNDDVYHVGSESLRAFGQGNGVK